MSKRYKVGDVVKFGDSYQSGWADRYNFHKEVSYKITKLAEQAEDYQLESMDTTKPCKTDWVGHYHLVLDEDWLKEKFESLFG